VRHPVSGGEEQRGTIPGVTDERVGRLIAAVRRHLGLRQVDLARSANVDQKVVSLLERGLLARVSVDAFRRVCAALQIEPVLELRWRGGLGDRLIDRGHARIVEAVLRELARWGWELVPEFTFNVFGERGSVDVLAWHAATGTLLILEIKTRLTDLQRLLMAMSRKLRLVPGEVARDRGWKPNAIGHVVVVQGTRANRSTIAAHAATFDAAFPHRTAAVRRWLRAPTGPMAGLWLIALSPESPTNRARVRRIASTHAQASPERGAPEATPT
jgi:transcriptional regulator with XRE-family HTH domain